MSTAPHSVELAVIGGGAAGFFTAINAARLNPSLSVTILEKSRQVLSKVRISGGGRCNVTHHCFDPEQLSKAYPRGQKALRWAFEHFSASDTVSWFNKRGVELKTEGDGRMFPVTDDSSTIIQSLMDEARRHNVRIATKTKVESIQVLDDGKFLLSLRKEKPLYCDKVLVASGGYNRAVAYEWLKDLGHSIQPPVPSLFTFNFRDKVFSDLAGISVPEASVKIQDTSFTYTGPILITHWGLSGPAILKASAWAARYLNEQEYRFKIQVNWVHPNNEDQVRSQLKVLRDQNARKLIKKQNHFEVPSRLWERLLKLAEIPEGIRWAQLSNQNVHDLAEQLVNGTYAIQGKTTYKEEFVTCGGIPLNEIDFGTMESKVIPGLYFAGEVLDIDGITGGYNFQAAWTTGWIAAEAISG